MDSLTLRASAETFRTAYGIGSSQKILLEKRPLVHILQSCRADDAAIDVVICMKKICEVLTVYMGIMALLIFPVSAQEVNGALEDTLTDSLTSQDDIRWYSFTMDEPGDAVLIVTGQQEKWDGYAYHWACGLYDADRETILNQAYVRGYSGDHGPSILSAPGLAAGTYYVRIQCNTGNPFLYTFTTEPYEMRLLRYYPSAEPTFRASKQIQSFQNAGDVLWAFDGTAFLKLYDGECWGGLMQSKHGAIVPVLISADERAVEYVVSSTGETVSAWSYRYCKDWDANRYFFSGGGNIASYTDKPVDTSALPMLYADTGSYGNSGDAAEKVFDQLINGFQEEPVTEIQPEEPVTEIQPEEPVADIQTEEPVTNIQAEEPVADIQPEKPVADIQLEEPIADIRSEKEETGDQPETSEDGGLLAWVMNHKAICVGIAVVLIWIAMSKSEGGSSSSYGGSYSSGGYSGSFDKPKSERSFTEGGPTGCGIGGSFCGYGSGR